MTQSVMSETRKVPEGYHTVQPYLMFVNTQEAMAFYAKVFGATEKLCMKSPEGRVVHAEIRHRRFGPDDGGRTPGDRCLWRRRTTGARRSA